MTIELTLTDPLCLLSLLFSWYTSRSLSLELTTNLISGTDLIVLLILSSFILISFFFSHFHELVSFFFCLLGLSTGPSVQAKQCYLGSSFFLFLILVFL